MCVMGNDTGEVEAYASGSSHGCDEGMNYDDHDNGDLFQRITFQHALWPR